MDDEYAVGAGGIFYESWTYGGEGWCRVMVPATECSRIGRDFLEEERGALGAAVFAREYMCEFLDCGAGVFNRELVEAALDDCVEPLELV